MAFIEKTENGIVYMSSSVLGTRHAFTTRTGGVSTGIYSSLNLGSKVGDPQPNVAENYRRVLHRKTSWANSSCASMMNMRMKSVVT